ncbi:30S ribosomal protein S19e [Candidatus Woesearchaeota archaeon]|nr:30S ribosomal protein S19e [Candidatus Woesearchaeota archaeon]
MHFQDVEPRRLIEALALELSSLKALEPPKWSAFVKTGSHKERPPLKDDWWFVRGAALLRTIALKGPVGISKLSAKYGGRKRRGHDPPVFRKGSRHIPRTILQQLEKSGFVKSELKTGKKGRLATPKGISLLDKTAQKLFKGEK